VGAQDRRYLGIEIKIKIDVHVLTNRDTARAASQSAASSCLGWRAITQHDYDREAPARSKGREPVHGADMIAVMARHEPRLTVARYSTPETRRLSLLLAHRDTCAIGGGSERFDWNASSRRHHLASRTVAAES
jgi:hypothetical protein